MTETIGDTRLDDDDGGSDVGGGVGDGVGGGVGGGGVGGGQELSAEVIRAPV